MEKYYYGGCDVGSTTGKAVIMDDTGIVASSIVPSEVDPERTAMNALNAAMKELPDIKNVRDLVYLIGTGYGRNEVPFADENISEITCHARGAFFSDPSIKTIIDIGGQDMKGIAVADDGSVLEFVMNDKCAAGTGRFYEAMSRIFRMELPEFSDLSLRAKKVIPVTAQCSVFAETEVISLLAKKNPAENICAGIQAAVAKRCFTLVKRVGLRPKLTVTGGCAKNVGLLKSLEDLLRVEIAHLNHDPQIMGAVGAAILARDKALMKTGAASAGEKQHAVK